jgi:hypothetical protein
MNRKHFLNRLDLNDNVLLDEQVELQVAIQFLAFVVDGNSDLAFGSDASESKLPAECGFVYRLEQSRP